MYDRKHQLCGFTLIELLLTIVIITVIGSFSVVFFSRFLTQNAVANTQDQLIGQLRKAQLYAMSGKQNGSWGVSIAPGKMTLFQGNTYATRNAAFDETFSVNSNITISGFSEIVFTRMTGLPNTSGTYTVSGSGSSKQVTVNSQGVASR